MPELAGDNGPRTICLLVALYAISALPRERPAGHSLVPGSWPEAYRVLPDRLFCMPLS
jgi:hypothetical protein